MAIGWPNILWVVSGLIPGLQISMNVLFLRYDMVYQPHLDIQEARIRPAGDWTVFEIQAVAPPTVERVHISLEMDTDLDNRPDYAYLDQGN